MLGSNHNETVVTNLKGEVVIKGGNASIYVSSMDDSVNFFTEKIGLNLKTRIGDEWAELEAGNGFIIGLHPANPNETIEPGLRGAIDIELNVTEPLQDVVAELKKRGVTFKSPIAEYPNVRIVQFVDPDNNVLILAEVLNQN